ncbi:MAG: hypothetical protein ATN33_07155 [Epulopiscium sp. Nele67-Bin001]|nr:MAG: hypothetical protein ATN33_07155 [Epulopiscium sp. Nele67-Bin001]
MIYRSFDDGDKEHSLLGFGIMRMPTNEDASINFELAEKMIDTAYNAGVNYFDTAYVYHKMKSEEFLGKALAKYPRESFFIATKLPLWHVDGYDDLDVVFNRHLSRLNMDYIDYYLVHAVNKERVQRVKDMQLIDWLIQKKAQGKIRHIGFSFHDDLDCLKDMLSLYDWDFCQLQINYADWNRFNAKDMYEIATKAGVPIIVMEPVRGGMLANPAPEVASLLKEHSPDLSYANWAFRFVANLDNVKLILSGMSTIEQVEDNLATFATEQSIELTYDESKILNKAINVLDNLKSIPCTACDYCMPCPFGVHIPTCFEKYNTAQIFGKANYTEIAEENRADKCVSCEACVPLCPQHIQIPERMVEVSDYFATK